MWLILALIGHLINAIVFIADKAFIEKLYPHPKVLTFIAGASGVFLFLLFPRFLTWAPPNVVWSAIVSGAMIVPALLCFFTALKKDEVSRVVPAVGSMVPIFTFILSYGLLGERLGGAPLAAFILLVLGGLLITFRSFAGIILRQSYALFLYMVPAALFFAAGFVFQKFAFDSMDDFSAFLWSRIGAVGAALPLLFYASVRERLKFPELKNSGLKMGGIYIGSRILAGIAPLVILIAISFGSVTLVNALQGIQYAFLFVLAVFFSQKWPGIFKEETGPLIFTQKIVATVFIIAGLALLI